MPFTKINPKWIIDLNIICQTITFQEDNKGLGDFGFGDMFVDIIPKAR